MYPTTAEVMLVKTESDRDKDSLHVTIELTRHPAEVRYQGLAPDVSDLPEDFRKALAAWLEINPTDSLFKNE